MSLVLLGILNSQAAGAGGAGAFDLIETYTFSQGDQSVTFSNLPSDYELYEVRINMQLDSPYGGFPGNWHWSMPQYTGNMTAAELNAKGTTWAAGGTTGASYFGYDAGFIGDAIESGKAQAGQIVRFHNFNNSKFNPIFWYDQIANGNSSSSSGMFLGSGSTNTETKSTTFTSITFQTPSGTNYQANSGTMKLYGYKRA